MPFRTAQPPNRVLLLVTLGFVLATLGPLHSQSARRLAWNEIPVAGVAGFTVTVDGVKTDYGATPLPGDGTCNCAVPLPFSSGRHTVLVSAYNAAGESTSAPLTVGPTAKTGGPYVGQVGTPLTVTAASSTDTTGTIVSYVWAWGDGTGNTSSSTATASHTYASAGVFPISVTVTDDFPASHTASTTAAIAAQLPPGPPASDDVIIYASDIASGSLHGAWTTVADLTSAGGIKLVTPDAGWASNNAPLAAPAHYVDVPFDAAPGTPYTLWLRLRAQDNSKYNDAVWVQFSDARVNGSPVYPLNSTSGLLINLATDVAAASLNGWGWQHGAYWLTQAATVTFSGSATHTLRIQVREDGVQFDQIVLSPNTYLSAPPGPPTNDATILPKNARPGVPVSPAPSNGAISVSATPALTWSAIGATSYDVSLGVSNPPPLAASDQAAASYTPSPALTAGTKYYWQVVARNGNGTTAGPVWSFTTAPPASTSGDIVIYAGDLQSGSLHGAWTTAADLTSAGGIKLVTPDAGWASNNAPLAAPAHYVDVPFDAAPGTPYTLWLRLRAQDNSKYNDAVWVQFSDARVNGSPVYSLNSTSGLLINLATDVAAASLNGWGWQHGAYWLSQAATVTFSGSATHTLRIQVREDGVQLDQVVLSPNTYLSAPPGPPTNDATILRK